MAFPLIIAHRGAPGRQKENTLRGFREGISRGAEWVELDIHRTCDGAVVVFHDPVIKRKPLAGLTVAEAKRLARESRNIDLPTLAEVLEVLPESIGLNIEIKARAIGPELISLLAQQRATERVVCSSFYFSTVAALAELRPRVRTGILTASRLADPVGTIRRARAQAIFQEYRFANRRLVNRVHEGGLHCFVWTVNRLRDLKAMVALGVDGIITDFPDRLAHLRRAEESRESRAW